MLQKFVRPDSKGRITLGHLADGISGYALTQTNDRKIILEPYTEIPVNEKWLFSNKKDLLKTLVSKITPENKHNPLLDDQPHGKEEW
ncbi:MAG: hypothetical protein RLZ35_258 [Pseudomonadota bacterium]